MFAQLTNCERGFNMIELMVSIGILGIATAGFTLSSVQLANHLTSADTKSKAILAAQQVLDEMRLEDPSLMPSSYAENSPVDIVINQSTFNVVVSYCDNMSFCPPSTSTDTRHLKVVVSYKGNSVYETETVFTKLR